MFGYLCNTFDELEDYQSESGFVVPPRTNTLEQYCEDHPDSTFARDMAMNRDDIRNVTRRTLPNLWELHPDPVCYINSIVHSALVHTLERCIRDEAVALQPRGPHAGH